MIHYTVLTIYITFYTTLHRTAITLYHFFLGAVSPHMLMNLDGKCIAGISHGANKGHPGIFRFDRMWAGGAQQVRSFRCASGCGILPFCSLPHFVGLKSISPILPVAAQKTEQGKNCCSPPYVQQNILCVPPPGQKVLLWRFGQIFGVARSARLKNFATQNSTKCHLGTLGGLKKDLSKKGKKSKFQKMKKS